MAVVVIPQFERLAVASTLNYGGPTAGIIVVQEDADTITGSALEHEADRVAALLMGGSASEAGGGGELT